MSIRTQTLHHHSCLVRCRLTSYLFISALLCSTVLYSQTTVYVNPTSGSDSNNGAIGAPFRTIEKGLTTVKSGGIVYLRGGTYSRGVTTLSLTGSGTSGNRIRLWAYGNEVPILDFTGQAVYSNGIDIAGSYYHLRGITVQNSGYSGIWIHGSHNVIEHCTARRNFHTGMKIIALAGEVPTDNLIWNCDSYANYDPPAGGNADGFNCSSASATNPTGAGNVFRACRAWNNTDDGFDLWLASEPVTLDSCWSWHNGWHPDSAGVVTGDGNGFKLGGSGVSTDHILTRCLAFDNRMRGYDGNYNAGHQTLRNCVAFRNGWSGIRLIWGGPQIIENSISYLGGHANEITNATQIANSWATEFSVNSAYFSSLDTTGVTGSRDPNGSLPIIKFLRLAPASPFIDAGVNVGLPFNGSAPDVGAFEVGDLGNLAPPAVPTNAFPANGVAAQPTTLTLAWNASTGATSYHLQVARDQTFATTVFDDSTVTTTSRQIGSLLNSTTYYWHVQAKNQFGLSFWSDPTWEFTTSALTPVGHETSDPRNFELYQNYPNPFNPTTTISFWVPITSDVTLSVVNILGQEVGTPFKNHVSAGRYSVEFSGDGLSSGVYLYLMKAGTFTSIMRMMLVK